MRGSADRRGSGRRPLRVARDLQRRLAEALAEGVGDGARPLVLTRVEMSVDLGHARVYYVLEASVEEAESALDDEEARRLARLLRRRLADGWPLRRLPEIVLVADEEWRREERLLELLHDVETSAGGDD
jgi:ribosome-binding factor A